MITNQSNYFYFLKIGTLGLCWDVFCMFFAGMLKIIGRIQLIIFIGM